MAREDNITGTHEGEFMGHPADGRAVQFRGAQVGRVDDGLLVDRWGSSDQPGVLQQLSLASP